MKHFDLFSGYGGFSLALQKVYGDNRLDLQKQETENLQQNLSYIEEQSLRGFNGNTIGFSEIDKYASSVLKYHWPNTKNYGDITKINWSEVPDFDLLTGGSPCQDLSIAGKRAGLEGARSGLFYEYMRAVKEKRPKYFIWENVKGALSSNKGFDFGAVINEMAETGYSLWWQVLNAKDFGVPQNRERIFVIGFRDGSPREVFFEREGYGINTGENAQRNEVAYCLNAGGDKHRGSYIKQLNNPTHSNNRLYSEEGISPSLNTAQGGNRKPKILVLDTNKKPEYNGSINNNTNHYDSTKERRPEEEMSSVQETTNTEKIQGQTGGLESLSKQEILRLGVSQGDNAEQMEKRSPDESGKLSGGTTFSEDGDLRDMQSRKENGNTPQEREQNGQSIEKFNGSLQGLPHDRTSNGGEKECLEEKETKQPWAFSIRRLTCKEAERLMGLPDNWLKYGIDEKGNKFELSDSQKYKMAGNGVVVNVVEELLKNIITPSHQVGCEIRE